MNWVYMLVASLLLAVPQVSYTLQDVLAQCGNGFCITTTQPGGDYLPVGAALGVRYGDGHCQMVTVQGYVIWSNPPRPVVDYLLVTPGLQWYFMAPPLQNTC